VDGLKGFPEAIESVYPRTEVQLCIVHLVRASLNYVTGNSAREVAGAFAVDLPGGTVIEAETQRDEFRAQVVDATYPNGESDLAPELGSGFIRFSPIPARSGR